MEFKHCDRNTFKEKWQDNKIQIVKIKGRQVNHGFFKDLNKYFNNFVIDISSTKPGKTKKKLGLLFELPDKKEYLMKVTTKDNECKIQLTTPNGDSMYCEYILQMLSFLLTL